MVREMSPSVVAAKTAAHLLQFALRQTVTKVHLVACFEQLFKVAHRDILEDMLSFYYLVCCNHPALEVCCLYKMIWIPCSLFVSALVIWHLRHFRQLLINSAETPRPSHPLTGIAVEHEGTLVHIHLLVDFNHESAVTE